MTLLRAWVIAAAFLVLAIFLMWLPSCSGPQERAACAPEALAAIEVAYVDEALQACEGHEAEDCEALPAIREKYAVKRRQWEDCQ